MTFERYTIGRDKFHCLQLEDNIKNRKYGCFDRFEEKQLQELCDELNSENQAGQDYEDMVHNVIIDANNIERTEIGRSVIRQIANELGVEL